MNQQVDPNANLLVGIGALWLMGLALCRLMGIHNWYLRTTKKVVSAPVKWSGKVLAAAWNKHQKFFWGMVAGFLTLLYVLSHSHSNPSP